MGKLLTNEEVQNRLTELYEEPVSLISTYKGKRAKITLHCNKCGYEWETMSQNALYLRCNEKHRCPNCLQEERDSTKFKTVCAYCGKTIIRYKKEVDKNQTGYFYCSRECGNLHKNALRMESGEWDNSVNYRNKAFTNYPHQCLVCGWKEDERILEVHHLDEDRSNNKLDNLCILCPTCHRKITLGYYFLDINNHQLIQQ